MVVYYVFKLIQKKCMPTQGSNPLMSET